VAHACNPRYSGGRDQEDCDLKPALGKQFMRSYLEKKQKKAGTADGVAQGAGLEFKPQYRKNKIK
jgi:hypothetical protein